MLTHLNLISMVTLLLKNAMLFAILTLVSIHVHASSWTLSEQEISARHESGLVSVADKLYLIGGRGNKPLEVFEPQQSQWSIVNKQNPMELHHFQALGLNEKIYIIGAFTGPWPNETPIANVLVFDTQTNTWQSSTPIPKERQRGAASAAIYNDHIYIVGGSTEGHMQGTKLWFDKYNPKTHTFTALPDAPIERDHAQAAVVGDYLYHFGGRKTWRATGNDFNLTVAEVDRYSFKTNKWETLNTSANLPTPRAGGNSVVIGDFILYIGGESASQKIAHNEVQAFNTNTLTWHTLSGLQRGRHSGGAAIANNTLYVVSGSGNRGGRPELANHELISIKDILADIH